MVFSFVGAFILKPNVLQPQDHLYIQMSVSDSTGSYGFFEMDVNMAPTPR